MEKTITPKPPVKYSGQGSAIDNYFGPNPEKSAQEAEQKRWEEFDYNNKQHRYILSMLHTIGWTKVLKGKTVGNMATFAHWLQNHSPIKKPLVDMTPQETPRVVFAFEQYVKYFFK